MNKNFGKIICAVLMSVLMLFASACTFFNAEETRTIARIYSVEAEDADGVYIVIEYEGDFEDDRFFIADPPVGKDGNGIKSVTSRPSDDGFSTVVTVTYTDETTNWPTEFTIPNGKYISSIDSATDPDSHVVTLTINFSDGSDPVEILLYPGKDGKDGDRIKDFRTEVDEETGETRVYIVYERWEEATDEAEAGWREYEFPEEGIPIPAGKEGKGIRSIRPDYNSYVDLTQMSFLVEYNDGSTELLTIPRANSWYTGTGVPTENQYNIGDFYFDLQNYAIYQKVKDSGNDAWKKIVEFNKDTIQDITHKVDLYVSEGMRITVEIGHNECFLSAGKESELFTPQMDGYVFAGWYTEQVEPGEKPSPNAGHFTVLTPVLCNLSLYPVWEKLPTP